MPTPSTARLHDFTVLSNREIARDIYEVLIIAPELARTIRPGQFVNIEVPGNPASILRVPLSYAAADPSGGTVTIWYAVVGEGTERLSRMRGGDSSTLVGPAGHGWTVPAGCGCALLVAGGIGVPPVLCLARELAARGIPFDACLGAQTFEKVVGERELGELGAGEVVVCTDDGSYGRAGFCTGAAGELLSRGGYGYVATCGPAVMMHKVADLAAAAGAPCEASLERMMSCGFGACGTCAVETVDGMKGACMAGPVFDASKVVAW